jgi:hypothetical protein
VAAAATIGVAITEEPLGPSVSLEAPYLIRCKRLICTIRQCTRTASGDLPSAAADGGPQSISPINSISSLTIRSLRTCQRVAHAGIHSGAENYNDHRLVHPAVSVTSRA